jgi:putative ABC transport system permease protein
MLRPRWRKVLRDLWSNKTRTLLVVLSIAVGVFAVGMIAGSQDMLANDLKVANDASNPISATLNTETPFDDELVQTIRDMQGVDDAEGSSTTVFQVSAGPDVWKNTQFKIIPDFSDLRIGKIKPISGAWPPSKKELLLERSSLSFLNTNVGDTVLVDLPNGTKREMRVAGAVYDVNWASQLFGFGSAYITSDTARWLGQTGDFTELRITVTGDRQDLAHITQVVSQVRDKIEKSGRTVGFVNIPDPPGKHWADQVLQAIMLIMSLLGIISLLMSGFLVVNTIGALLMQQTRQIGVMKSIGARSRHIVGMYLMMVGIFGGLALLIAIPLGAFGAQVFVKIFAGLLNFDALGGTIPMYVIELEVAAGLLVPLLAALWPVFAGTRVTVREAISGYGLGKGRYGTSPTDRLLGRVRFLSRPMLLSLRNTFRRKGRLALTLSTLVLGGAMLISVLTVRASLLKTLDDFFLTYNYDLNAFMERPFRVVAIENEVRQVPGVVDVESWGQTSGRRVLADRTKTPGINITGLPQNTTLFQPKIVAGRWLLPEDQNAIVIAADLLKTEPDLKIGDDLLLDINGRELSWRIVGIAQVLFVDRQVYASYDYLARATNNVGQSSTVVVVTQQHDAAFRAQVAQDLRARFKLAGLKVSGTQTISELRSNIEFQFNIIVVMLLVMAVLLAVVGGLGLMGTMSINVIERTREIGVMRAIGASNGAILRIVIVEGVLIGVVSWLIAFALAFPFSMLLNSAVGQAFLRGSISYTFSLSGVLLWLAIVVALAGLASFLPAWNATRVTVRDVLSYE